MPALISNRHRAKPQFNTMPVSRTEYAGDGRVAMCSSREMCKFVWHIATRIGRHGKLSTMTGSIPHWMPEAGLDGSFEA